MPRNINICLAALFCLPLFMAGCTEEQPGEGRDRTATVTIRGTAGAGSDLFIDENSVAEIDLLVFHNGLFYQRSEGYELEFLATGSYSCKFNVDMFDGEVDFFFVANAGEDIARNMPYRNQGMESVRRQLTASYSRESLSRTTIPMSCHRNYPSGIDDDLTVAGIGLYRVGAKVEVVVKEELKSDFSLEMVQVYRANDMAQLVQDDGALEWSQQKGMYVVTSPSVPVQANQRINTQQVVCLDSQMTESIFIPESTGPQPREEATCIVLRGSYMGNRPGYYTLHFDPDGKLGEVLRNSHYRITITSVSGNGTEEPGVPDIDPLEFTVEILDWEEDEMGAASDYMAVSSHTINLHFYSASTGAVTVKTNVDDYQIRWCDASGNVIGSDVANVGQELRNEAFKVAVEEGGARLRATALTDNDQDDYRTAHVLVSSGNIHIIVHISQATRGMRDYIHIFNLTELYGNIGDEVLQVGNPYDPFSVYGRGLKEILKNENNFGPNGTVPFEGFYISGLHHLTPLSPYLLEIFDVIYIPTTRTDVVDTREAAYLYDWVLEPNHALVIQSDIGSNPKLLEYMGVTTQPFSISYFMEYKVSDQAPPIIADGPFGTITGTMPISLPGTASMIDAETHPWITPVLVRASPGYENYMIIGVDEANGIVYCGDFRLYVRLGDQGGGVLTGDGIIDNNYDTLFANLWAWIAEYVLDDNYDKDIR